MGFRWCIDHLGFKGILDFNYRINKMKHPTSEEIREAVRKHGDEYVGHSKVARGISIAFTSKQPRKRNDRKEG